MEQCALAAPPIRAGRLLPLGEWREVRERAIFEFCKWDVQCEDHSVLAAFPLLIERETERFLNEKAEALAREALLAEEEVLRNPELLEPLGLPGAIRRVFERRSTPHWNWPELRTMRFDFHFTTEGWRISEVNADVPGGFIEASAWNALFAEKWRGVSAPADVSRLYARAMREVAGQNARISFVHATAYSDDRQVMLHLARRFAAEGMQTCLCGPGHLRWVRNRAEFCAGFASGRPDAMVRFFPAEWLPNLGSAGSWQPYFVGGETPVSNPGRALVLQTKRFPLVWGNLRTELATWRELLPETRDAGDIGCLPSDEWVLKPALGRVGEGVGIKGVSSRNDLEDVVQRVRRRPRQWVAQRRFEIVPVSTDDGPRYPCIGVFTLGRKAAGLYGRISETPIIDRDARDVAVLIAGEASARQR